MNHLGSRVDGDNKKCKCRRDMRWNEKALECQVPNSTSSIDQPNTIKSIAIHVTSSSYNTIIIILLYWFHYTLWVLQKIASQILYEKGKILFQHFPRNLSKIYEEHLQKSFFLTPLTLTIAVLSYTLTLTAVPLTRVTLLLQRYLRAIFLYIHIFDVCCICL